MRNVLELITRRERHCLIVPQRRFTVSRLQVVEFFELHAEVLHVLADERGRNHVRRGPTVLTFVGVRVNPVLLVLWNGLALVLVEHRVLPRALGHGRLVVDLVGVVRGGDLGGLVHRHAVRYLVVDAFLGRPLAACMEREAVHVGRFVLHRAVIDDLLTHRSRIPYRATSDGGAVPHIG